MLKTYGASGNLDAWNCVCILQVSNTLQVREQRTGQERDRAEGRATTLVEIEKYGLKVLAGGDHGKPCCIHALNKAGFGRSSITTERLITCGVFYFKRRCEVVEEDIKQG